MNVESRLDYLAKSNAQLTTAIEGVAAKAELIERQNKQDKIIKWLIATIAVSIILILVLATITVQLYRTDRQVTKNTTKLQSVQTKVSSEVLCPLYVIMHDQIQRPPDPDFTKQEMEDFKRIVKAVERGYVALDCASTTAR